MTDDDMTIDEAVDAGLLNMHRVLGVDGDDVDRVNLPCRQVASQFPRQEMWFTDEWLHKHDYFAALDNIVEVGEERFKLVGRCWCSNVWLGRWPD